MPRSQWSTTRLPELVGVKEACEILAVDRRQLTRWCQDGSGTNGPRRTFMPPWQEVAATRIWTRADIQRLAERRASRVSELDRLQAEIRAELHVDDIINDPRWIRWRGADIAALSSTEEGGAGPWTVSACKPVGDDGPNPEWPVGATLAEAEARGLTLVAKRLAQDVLRGRDPRGPGGFAGPSITSEPHPELAAVADDWKHDDRG